MKIYRLTDDKKEKKLYLFKDVENIQNYLYFNINASVLSIVYDRPNINIIQGYVNRGVIIEAKISKEEVLKEIEKCFNTQIDYINTLNE